MSVQISGTTVIDDNKGLQNLAGIENLAQTFSSVTGTVTLNLSLYNVFYIAPAGAITISISNAPSSNKSRVIVLHIYNGGSYSITWPGDWKWAGGTTPTLGTGTSVDIIVATMVDATNWRAMRSQSHSS